MNKQLFDDAIGEVPPSTVDVDAAIVRGRRAARVRRLGSPVAAATVGVILVTGGVTVALLPPGGGQPPATGASDVDSLCAGTQTMPPIVDRSAKTSARLTGVLRPLVEDRLPAGGRLESPTGVDLPADASRAPLAFHPYGDCASGQDYLGAFALATWHGSTGTIEAYFERDNGGTDCVPSPEVSYCAERTGPNGERATLTTFVTDGTVVHQVLLSRPDGSLFRMAASNNLPDSDDPPTAAAPPLTLEQIYEIALVPDLTL